MSPESTLPPDAYELSEPEREEIFQQRILPVRFGEVISAAEPVAHFVGGQPGAGKSNLQQRLVTDLENSQGDHTVLSIVGDDLRVFHPRYSELLERSDEQAAYYTDLDSGAWVRRTIDHSLNQRANVVIEGTLRRPDLTQETAERYRGAGFGAELHVMVVHDFISRLSIVARYLKTIQREGHGRFTVRSAHDEAYRQLPDSLARLAEAGVFDRMGLYNREGDVVSEVQAGEANAAQTIVEALTAERQASLLPADMLLEQIERYEQALRPLGKTLALDDLAELRLAVHRLWQR